MTTEQAHDFFGEAIDLIEYARTQLITIENGYARAVDEKQVTREFRVQYKNFLENLRSALEYSAHGLVRRFGKTTKTKIYFPYAPLSMTREEFERRRVIAKRLPGVPEARPDIKARIELMQHFSGEGCRWFPQFMALTNTNKHVRLTPYEEMDGLEVTIGGLTIQAENIVVGPSGRIITDRGDIAGPRELEPNKPVVTTTGNVVEPQRWRALMLADYEGYETALEFIQHCANAIGGVVQHLSSTSK